MGDDEEEEEEEELREEENYVELGRREGERGRGRGEEYGGG